MYCMTSTTDVCAKNVSQDKYHRGAERIDAALSARFFMRYCAFFSCGKENENANNVY